MSVLPDWLEILQPKNLDPSLSGFGLGERQAISLANEVGADLVIIDDKAARKAAIDRHVNVIGTLGVLVRASEKGLINLELAVEKLSDSGFHVSTDLIDRLLGDR
jgi:predicted nucleic acid-binding protein